MMAPYETTDSHRESILRTSPLAPSTSTTTLVKVATPISHPQVLMVFLAGVKTHGNCWGFPHHFRKLTPIWEKNHGNKNNSDYTKFRPHLSRCPTPDSAFSLAPRFNHPKPLLKICFDFIGRKAIGILGIRHFSEKTQMLHTRVKVDGYLSSLNWLFNHENS